MDKFEEKYRELLENIYNKFPSFQVVGDRAFKPGLENMRIIDEALGYPSKDLVCIHIAGTNGKGSTSSMIASALMQLKDTCGKTIKVGLYTSPHLIDFRERIKVNGEMISKEFVFSFLNENYNFFEQTNASFFEITTAMAFKYFSHQKVDIAVIECGLGGRLDSTNIISPILSIITNIGLDHCTYLGNTLEEIAFEKGGIIKEDTPVVIGEAENGVKEVFNKISHDKNSPIYFAQDLENVLSGVNVPTYLDLANSILNRVCIEKMDLKGDCQKKNIKSVALSLSLIISELFNNKTHSNEKVRSSSKTSFKTNETSFNSDSDNSLIVSLVNRLNLSKISINNLLDSFVFGIENSAKITSLRGRWEILSNVPLTICDIGHNVHGLNVLIPQVERVYRDKKREDKNCKLIIIFGVMRDKDLSSELSILPKDAYYIWCNATSPRALPATELSNIMIDNGFKGELAEQFGEKSSIEMALEVAKRISKPEDFIFIGGSSYVVAEVLEKF